MRSHEFLRGFGFFIFLFFLSMLNLIQELSFPCEGEVGSFIYLSLLSLLVENQKQRFLTYAFTFQLSL